MSRRNRLAICPSSSLLITLTSISGRQSMTLTEELTFSAYTVADIRAGLAYPSVKPVNPFLPAQQHRLKCILRTAVKIYPYGKGGVAIAVFRSFLEPLYVNSSSMKPRLEDARLVQAAVADALS